jgi:hypothetical protein
MCRLICPPTRLFFAWIDTSGNWNQKAEMGWWACTHDKNSNAGNEFQKFIDSMPNDQMLYVVDCHI